LIATEESIFKTTIKEMQKIIKENQDFVYLDVPAKEAVEILKNLDQPYTLELCEDLIKAGEKTLGFYLNTINAQAAQKLLANSKPAYIKKYEEVTAWFIKHYPKAVEGKFVVFVNMCK
jgi:threonyl-tRNA synthetase